MLKLAVALLVLTVIHGIPFEDQMTLASSLIVGRDDESDLYNWQCKVCNPQNKPIHAHIIEEKQVDVKCIITVYEEFVILAFRYTNTALNVWQDILYPLQIVDEHTCSNCKVQKAYHNMWETIKKDVLSDLKKIQSETKLKTLYITGISMGGGLSVLSFIDINHENIFKNVKVTTYGAPRVGNNKWAAFYDLAASSPSRRYIIKGDPIVVMPRCLTLLCTYQHTGIQIVCNENTEICQENEDVDDLEYITQAAIDHMMTSDEEIQGIDSHINGYPKLYNYTLKLK